MSIMLPAVDLSSAVVGTSGVIDWAQFQPTSAPGGGRAHVQLFNESGCSLTITRPQTGDSLVLPAGGWRLFTVAPGETRLSYSVLQVLPNAPISKLYSVYYSEYEPPPPPTVLGNSPIGVSGTVTTVGSIQTLTDNPVQVGTGVAVDLPSITIPVNGRYVTTAYFMEQGAAGNEPSGMFHFVNAGAVGAEYVSQMGATFPFYGALAAGWVDTLNSGDTVHLRWTGTAGVTLITWMLIVQYTGS